MSSLDKFDSFVNRIEVAVVELEEKINVNSNPSGKTQIQTQKLDIIDPYKKFLNQFFASLAEAAKGLPEHIQTITRLFGAVFEEVGVVLQNIKNSNNQNEVTANYKKSVDVFFQNIVKIPISHKNHTKALEEAVKANNWIFSSSPVSEVHNNWDIGEFYALKIKTRSEDLLWVKALRNLMVNLEMFVNQNYPTGIVWAEKSTSSSSSSTPTVNLAAALAVGHDGTSAFGLKHVTADQKTKNRAAEDKKFTVPSEIGPKSVPKALTGPAKSEPPSWRKFGNKLSVENYVNDKTLRYEADEGGKDVIYLFNNRNSVLSLVRKVNSISVDKCTGTSLVVDDVISSIEIVNSRNITVQLTGVAASIVVDSTDEVKVYLTDKAAEKLEVFSSKSGNIVLYKPTKQKDPDTGEEYDGHIELAVPGTVRSVIVNNTSLDNTFVKHG